MLTPIIMAGGSGSRLWPLSRTLYPKQFLAITSENTMLQETIARLDTIKRTKPIIICNEEHRFIVAEQLRKKNYQHNGIILEPVGRNTAPAVALAALRALDLEENPVLLVLAADHTIQNTEKFTDAIHAAYPLALQGKLITFGIQPDLPETGYGYILKGEEIAMDINKVASFVEKPDIIRAQQYLDSGDYLWNSGIFMFQARVYLDELKKHRPDILDSCQKALQNSHIDLDFIRVDAPSFNDCPDDSIDYAVMEHTDKAIVIGMDAKWNDVGSWSAIWEVSDKDEYENATCGDVLMEHTSNSYVYSQSKLVATVGVDNLVIVETKDAVLVANKDSVQDVKGIVNQLKEQGRTEYLQHREVFRPWGSHDAVADAPRYHVKRVTVLPGKRTAMQVHFNRAEHWVVVSGTAMVHQESKSFLVYENESTYIPVGVAHSIENPGKIPLEIIEVRTGSYLGEDDVLRPEEKGAGY